MNYYISDFHFGHRNIIEYCNRPFHNTHEMDAAIFEGLRLVDEDPNNRIYFLGDFAMNPNVMKGFSLKHPENHTMIGGNHDYIPKELDKYSTFFGTIIGSLKTWGHNHMFVKDFLRGEEVRLVLSHLPQTYKLKKKGIKYNLHGHIHDKDMRDYNLTQEARVQEFMGGYTVLPEGSPLYYLNAGVEHTGYRPVTLDELVDIHENTN